LAAFEEASAFRGNHEGPFCAVDQLRPQFFFKLPDSLTRGGLRNAVSRSSE
jgi:hypothetical protein